MKLEENIRLKEHTTFGIGGNAKYFATVRKDADLQEAIAFAKEKNLPIFVLGGGSNILVSDGGFDGLVIKNELKLIEIHGREITARSGSSWDKVVEKCVEQDMQGIECLSGIPGTFGGAIVQNIGAYGQTLSKVVESVEAVDLATGEVRIFKNDECEFEYRNSYFKKNPGKYFVSRATLKLNYSKPELNYPSLVKYFEKKDKPTVSEVRKAVVEIRASKGMVILPGYDNFKSAGSFFKNPVVTRKVFKDMQHKINCPPPWHWEDPKGIKIAAACLVTNAGFSKGQMLGRAQISPLQPLAIINPDDATFENIMFAANHIKQMVFEKFGIMLEEEIMYIR